MEEASNSFLIKSDGDTYLPPFDISCLNKGKLRSTLRQIAREWTSEGQAERDAVFKPCINILEKMFPDVTT